MNQSLMWLHSWNGAENWLFLWTGQSRAWHLLWLAWCPSWWGSASCALRWTASGTSTITAPAAAKRFGLSLLTKLCSLETILLPGFFTHLLVLNSAGGRVQEVWPVPRGRCDPVDRAKLRRACVVPTPLAIIIPLRHYLQNDRMHCCCSYVVCT